MKLFHLFYFVFSLVPIFLVVNCQTALRNNDDCYVMAQYFARIRKPLSKHSVVLQDKSTCQRFERVIRKRGVSAVDRKLRALLAVRLMRNRYEKCMEKFNSIRHCKMIVEFSMFNNKK